MPDVSLIVRDLSGGFLLFKESSQKEGLL